MKYIFVTGGVVSSLGKGLAAAALGTLLELRGLRVVFQKFDPYLNVDPGTMSPFQHGAVYVLNIHVTLIPYIKAARELKTKPTQQSIAKLREIGLQPQVLMCRTEHPLDAELRQKLSMFCSVAPEAVIEFRDVEHSIYEAPLIIHEEGMDALICKLLRLQTPEPDRSNWRKFVERVVSPKTRVK